MLVVLGRCGAVVDGGGGTVVGFGAAGGGVGPADGIGERPNGALRTAGEGVALSSEFLV